MYKYFCILLFFIANVIYSQPETVNEKRQYGYGYNTIHEIKLFDTAEIRKSQFKTAYLIYHPCNWSNGKTNSSDTLMIYNFDFLGFVKEHTYIDTTGERTTSFFDNKGNVTRVIRISKIGNTLLDNHIKESVDTISLSLKEVRSNIKDGLDSIFTTLMLDQVGLSLDTFFYIKKVVDENGKEKEYQFLKSKRFVMRFHQKPYNTHYKYFYDKLGRLIKKEDLIALKTYKTSYFDETTTGRTYRPVKGELLETIDATSNSLLSAQIKYKNEDDVITITTKQKHVIISPLKKGSQLVKLLTVIVTEEIPTLEYYEIIYK